jgi:hypothetical protein
MVSYIKRNKHSWGLQLSWELLTAGFLLTFLLDPEDGGDMYLRNVG